MCLALRRAPVSCHVAPEEVKEGGGSKETERTLVPNVALWNAGFQ
jgi:hypothetical protein